MPAFDSASTVADHASNMVASTSSLNARRPGYRASMCRDLANPDRVVPDPNAWRDRKAAPGPFRTPAELRYARNEMAEWHGIHEAPEGRSRVSCRAMKLYEILCGIALGQRSLGRLDLSYGQLMRRLGVPEVELTDLEGSVAVDDWGDELRALDPEWGQGMRTLQRTLRELADAGFVSIGYVVNRNCGGHRLCLELGGPDWFLEKVKAASGLGRAKGGRTSRPPARRTARSLSQQAQQRDCAHCHGVGVIEQSDGSCVRCNHCRATQDRAGP